MTASSDRRRPRLLSVHKMIPNMITLTAMSAGMTSIKFAIGERWEAAVLAIVVAAFMDAFDGAAARLLKAQSKIGAELDSFSDFISFGVAPALVIYLWALEGHAGKWGWPVALLFAIAVALRLSRFNVGSDEKESKESPDLYFTGVPSPIGAGLCLLPMIVAFQAEPDIAQIMRHPAVVGGWAVILAAMMVSNIPTFSSKQIKVPYRFKVPALGLFAILLAGLINLTWPTLALMGAIYLLTLPVAVRNYARRKNSAAPAEDVDENDDGGE